MRRYTERDNFLDWSSLHAELDPGITVHGRLPESRANRKKMQIKSMWMPAIRTFISCLFSACLGQMGSCLKEELRSTSVEGQGILGLWAERVSGAGNEHLVQVLATMRSDATIYIVEKKRAHCDIAQKRSDLMG